MSAIRPLATIAMLMVLGYFLWTRINTPELEQATESELALEDAPSLSLDLEEDVDLGDSAPPPFEPTATAVPPAADAGDFSFGPAPEMGGNEIAPLDSAEIAAMPELPPLPSEVPTADFSNAPPAASSGSVAGRVPSLGTEVGSTDNASAPPADNGIAVPPLPSDSLAALENGSPDNSPLPPMPDSTNELAASPPMNDSLSGMAASELAPEGSEFTKAKPAIDAALARGELEQAHLLLSNWYGEPTLTPAERAQVEGLLSQLAGTVIYSNEHRLEPPHRVQPGETLETIAQTYNIPWQLLAKINGVPQAAAVTPGQELKVIRGPFSAVVDVEQQHLALVVAERYAGRFNVKTEGQAATEGEWVVTQKQMPSGYGTTGKQLVLEPAEGPPGAQLVLGPPSDNAPTGAGAIRVAPSDQNDLYDILSIGSRVMIRR